jgi:hypothetical protein
MSPSIPLGCTRLPNLARDDWWMLAIVVSIIWGIEGVMEGNTLGEILVGPVARR